MPTADPPTVAIIGCGPSGMFFLHALATKRRMLEEKGDMEGLAKLPHVTCFERSSQPGGLWRAADADNNQTIRRSGSDIDTDEETDSDDEVFAEFMEDDHSMMKKTTNMYDALWTNGPKEFIEFYDYTFDEHFKKNLPVFMPRDAILDYILTRVTRNNPNIFDAVKFESTVKNVTYDKSTCKFEFTILDNKSLENSTHYFDKCIWGAGENGKPYIPRAITSTLKKEKFKGDIVHSSAIGSILCDVKDKTIVMFGDAFSAEDLALQAIKRGAKMIYIVSRTGRGICNHVTSWPGDKVKIIKSVALSKVIQDGNGLRFKSAKMNLEEHKQKIVKKGKTLDIEDVTAVVLCTGYDGNMSMLDPSLKQAYADYEEEEYEDALPDSWRMTSNSFTKYMGDVVPCEWLDSSYLGIMPNMHHGFLVDNPSMMFMIEHEEMPLFGIDISAWLLLSYITGDISVPSADEVRSQQLQIIEEGMQNPYIRMYMDINYFKRYMEVENDTDMSISNATEHALTVEKHRIQMKQLASVMTLCNYPLNIGTAHELNEIGEKYVSMLLDEAYARQIDPKSEDSSWRTFRDSDPSNYSSIHTGTPACHLKTRWLDLGDDAASIL